MSTRGYGPSFPRGLSMQSSADLVFCLPIGDYLAVSKTNGLLKNRRGTAFALLPFFLSEAVLRALRDPA
jgi:hypothetical protein